MRQQAVLHTQRPALGYHSGLPSFYAACRQIRMACRPCPNSHAMFPYHRHSKSRLILKQQIRQKNSSATGGRPAVAPDDFAMLSFDSRVTRTKHAIAYILLHLAIAQVRPAAIISAE